MQKLSKKRKELSQCDSYCNFSNKNAKKIEHLLNTPKNIKTTHGVDSKSKARLERTRARRFAAHRTFLAKYLKLQGL